MRYLAKSIALLVAIGAAGPVCQSLSPGEEGEARTQFQFRDVGDRLGLFPAAAAIRGHGAAWGDVDNDGWDDLYIATFATGKSKPNLLLLNRRGGKFLPAPEGPARIRGRCTGVVFADLDNDGDLDLYVGSMPAPPGSRLAQRIGFPLRGCSLFRNDGGKFTDVSAGNGACPERFGGRSVAVLDYDGDGLLDLLVGEDPVPGYNGSPTRSSRLFRNLGGLRFRDVSQEVGISKSIPGLGVAAADVNNDGLPDLFLASNRGGNVLFLNQGNGRFVEAPGSRQTFAWKNAVGDNMICGVSFGDVNRDGLLDCVLGQHYDHPWREPVPIRLYLNRGVEAGTPRFEDVTEQVGLKPLPMKAPHVEIRDFDNDGWPDILTSIVVYVKGHPYPLIYRNQGVSGRLPRFREDALSRIAFPTAEDLAVRSSGKFFDKMLRDRKIIYFAPGPTCDFDKDGRLDIFFPTWWSETRSLLLRNETPGGHWLQVSVRGQGKVNRMGVGTRVEVYPAGKLGEKAQLIAATEVAVGHGYASGQTAVAHIGLGKIDRVDLRLTPPHRKSSIIRRDVACDRRIVVEVR